MTLRPTPWRGALLLFAAQELRAHGYDSAAASFDARTLAWLERRPRDELLASMNERYQFVAALMGAGRLEEAKEILGGLLEEFAPPHPNSLAALNHLAVIAARTGDRSEALRISRLEPVASNVVVRAQIAAELGELELAVDVLRDGFSNGVLGVQVLRNLHKNGRYRRLWDYPPFQELMRPKG
jgi:hypothetical protein